MEELNEILSGMIDKHAYAGDRRRAHERFTLHSPIQARLGRSAVDIIDISLGGARLEHASAVDRASASRLQFRWRGQAFDSPVQALSSRLISVHGMKRIVTRVAFKEMPEESADLLNGVVAALHDERISRWTANALGEGSESALPEDAMRPSRWLLYTRNGARWESRLFTGEALPGHGFLVPDTLPASDVDELCSVFPLLDPDSQELLRRCLSLTGATSQSQPFR